MADSKDLQLQMWPVVLNSSLKSSEIHRILEKNYKVRGRKCLSQKTWFLFVLNLGASVCIKVRNLIFERINKECIMCILIRSLCFAVTENTVRDSIIFPLSAVAFLILPLDCLKKDKNEMEKPYLDPQLIQRYVHI